VWVWVWVWVWVPECVDMFAGWAGARLYVCG